MSNETTQDLNAVIVAAVNARIEAQVAEALSGDALIGQYVASALSQPIEVPRGGSSYDKRKTTPLKEAIDNAVRDATKAALQKVVLEEQAAIEAAIRKQLRKDIPTIFAQLTKTVVDAAGSAYGVRVELKYPSRYS